MAESLGSMGSIMTKLITRTIGLLCAVCSSLGAQTQSPMPKAEIIFTHGNIYTGVIGSSALGSSPRAEAIAVRGDRILAVGTRAEIAKMKGPETKVVDLDGHFVMPGFNDAHMHLASAGLEKMNVDMVGVKSIEEFRQRLRDKAQSASPGNGWSARVGTKPSGQSRLFPRASMLTKSATTTRYSSAASMDTSLSPTRSP